MKGSMEYIREAYKVPAKRFGKIKYGERTGMIIGAIGSYLRVRLDGEKDVRLLHPTYKITYLA